MPRYNLTEANLPAHLHAFYAKRLYIDTTLKDLPSQEASTLLHCDVDERTTWVESDKAGVEHTYKKVIFRNLYLKGIDESEKYYIPGTITAVFEQTQAGKKGVSVEISNSYIDYLLRNNTMHLVRSKTEAACAEEANSLQKILDLAPEKCLKEKGEKVLKIYNRKVNKNNLVKYASVLALVRQIIIDPYDDALISSLGKVIEGNLNKAVNEFITETREVKNTSHVLTEYLAKEENARHLEENIRTKPIKLTFNNLVGNYKNPQVEELLLMFDKNKEKLRSNLNYWVDYIIAVAINELLNEDGSIKPEILSILKTKGFNENQGDVQKQLISSYITNFIMPGIQLILKPLVDSQISQVRDDEEDPLITNLFDRAYNERFDPVIIDAICIQTMKHHFAENEFVKAKADLIKATKDTSKDNMHRFGARRMIQHADKIAGDPGIPIQERPQLLNKLTKSMNVSCAYINDPIPVNKTKCIEVAKEIQSYSKLKIVAGILLGIAGAVLVGASIGAALVSFGAASPISFFGAALGAGMISFGIGMGVGAAGLGMAAASTALIASEAKPKSLNETLEEMARKAPARAA